MMSKIPPGELPVAVVQAEIREMIARRMAEEWARDNMQIVKRALEGATGDAEKYKRVLNKHVAELNLTHGPKEKDKFYHRYSIDSAKEFEPLKEAFGKYIDMINLFEGRDINPDRLLKAGDFHRMFFDSTEHFSASSQYRAMTWPPVVVPNKARTWKKPNTRLINQQNINPEINREITQSIMQSDQRKDPPNFDLFNNAEKPILFWRVTETEPVRPTDYKKIDVDLNATREALKKAEADLAKAVTTASKTELQNQVAKLKLTESDLLEINNNITNGFKFEKARIDLALPKAKAIAEELIKSGNDKAVLLKAAETLKREVIPLPKVTRMFPERLPNFDTDYFEYQLPKDEQLVFPREDMSKQIVDLYEPSGPIEIKDAELDKINKELYNLAKEMYGKAKDGKKDEKGANGKYVQILTNKPRSVFYIAVVTSPPRADVKAFADAVTGAPFERRFARDHFVTRAQQQEGKQFRAGVVRYLGSTLGFSDVSEKAREDFDRVGGGD